MQSESVLIQKIYTHFKRAPGTHKLGVLYVVDSVTRQWVESARRAGQPAGSSAPDGTFAAGVNRVTELLPVLMNDIINNAPEDQKVRVLLDTNNPRLCFCKRETDSDTRNVLITQPAMAGVLRCLRRDLNPRITLLFTHGAPLPLFLFYRKDTVITFLDCVAETELLNLRISFYLGEN